MEEIHFEYFQIKEKYKEFKGDRYFKIGRHLEFGVQVVLHAGDVRKGRGNMLGINVVSKITWYANYMGPGYIEPCPKKVYDKAFKEAIQLLS